MRSFGRALAASLALAASAPGSVALGAAALEAKAAGQDPEALYNEVLAHERALRRELDLAPQLRAQPPGEASTALLLRVRDAVGRYEALTRRFPRSGYSDNALWQAAVLAADAFWQFGDTNDRADALRLFDLLKSQYPTSSLVARIAGHTTRLHVAETRLRSSTLRAIRREVLPDALRITLELEREAVFHEERLEAPPRVFVDLQSTQAVEALNDATLAFSDDVVRQARVGRQPDNRTRVELDLDGAARYSVYSLYNPYRIVLDFERAAPTNGRTIAPTNAGGIAPTNGSGIAPTSGPIAPTSITPIAPTSVRPVAPASVRPIAPASEGPIAPTTDKSIAPTPAAAPAAASANSRGGFSLSRQLGLGISRIVIDPGHGGQDPGARVRGLNEAELVLDVALRLEQLLLKEPGVEVVLTRRANTYVTLEQRTGIANRSAADLFLSIHANASASASVRGFETYFLNFAPNPEAEALAARENAGSSRTMGNLPDIVKAIALNNKLDESRDFAAMLQASMHERLRRVDRQAKNLGVKQAPFMVLIGATMPSALAEVSFLTNRREATLLRSQNYRQQIAEALSAGILKYQRTLKSTPVLRSRF